MRCTFRNGRDDAVNREGEELDHDVDKSDRVIDWDPPEISLACIARSLARSAGRKALLRDLKFDHVSTRDRTYRDTLSSRI